MSRIEITSLALLLFATIAQATPLGDAKEHFAAGRFQEAIKAAETVAEKDADYARAQYLRGEIALMLDDVEQATTSFRSALKVKPKAEPILTGLGRALLAAEEYAEAKEVLGRAVKAKPTSARAHCFLGIATQHDTLGAKGKKSIDKGLKLGGDDPVITQAAVLFYLGENKLKKATQVADRFRKKNKKHPLGYFLRALALERSEKYDDAIEAYQKAIALDEHFLDAHKNLAILCIAQNPLYKNKKRTQIAMKHFESYRKLGGKDPALIQIHETLKKFIGQITGG